MPPRELTSRAGIRLAVRLGLIVAAILVVLGVLEIVLRVRPTLLGQGFASGALSRYTVRAGGIYYRDRTLRMNFMIPNFETTMYANGYVWRHQTDALGFRNAPLHIPADVVVLGDSLVYGQGADFEDTLGNRLEERSGLRVVNLGLQGDCAFQEAYRLTAYIEVFTPRFVVYVFTPNDIEDLYVYLSDAAMEAFIAQPVEAVRYPERIPTDVALRERAERIRHRPHDLAESPSRCAPLRRADHGRATVRDPPGDRPTSRRDLRGHDGVHAGPRLPAPRWTFLAGGCSSAGGDDRQRSRALSASVRDARGLALGSICLYLPR